MDVWPPSLLSLSYAHAHARKQPPAHACVSALEAVTDRPRRCRSFWRQRSQSFASATTTRRLPRVLRRRHLLARSRTPLKLHHCVADASALHFAVAADGLFVCCAAQAMPPALQRTDRAVHALTPTRHASPRRSTRPASRSESAVPVPAALPRVFRGPFDG